MTTTTTAPTATGTTDVAAVLPTPDSPTETGTPAVGSQTVGSPAATGVARAQELTDRAADVVQELGTRVGGELLGADLGKELRESALLLGLALVVVGLVAALASTALLLG